MENYNTFKDPALILKNPILYLLSTNYSYDLSGVKGRKLNMWGKKNMTYIEDDFSTSFVGDESDDEEEELEEHKDDLEEDEEDSYDDEFEEG